MRTSLDSITPPQRSQSSTVVPPRSKAARKTSSPSPSRPIEINISLPNISWIRFTKLRAVLRRIPRRTYLFLVVSIILASTALFIADRQRKTDYTTTTTNGTPVTRLEKGQPEYPTILPDGKSITELGGWTRISPPDRNPVFAYVDVIDGIPATISEQPLPDVFKEDIERQISSLAEGYHADVKIDANGTTVYIGASAKGPQSVIFTKNNLLILIKASSKVSNDAWAAYVSSLN